MLSVEGGGCTAGGAAKSLSFEIAKRSVSNSMRMQRAVLGGGGPGGALALIQGSGFRVQGSGYRVQGTGFRVQGSGFRVQGIGFRVPRSSPRKMPPPAAGIPQHSILNTQHHTLHPDPVERFSWRRDQG